MIKEKETAMSLKNMGLIYHYKGDYEKAEVYYKKSLEMLKSVVTKPSFERALVLDAYGTLMTDQGEYEKAKKITEEASSNRRSRKRS